MQEAEIQRITAVVNADLSKYTRDMDSLVPHATGVFKGIEQQASISSRTISERIRAMGDGFKGIGQKLSLAVTAPIMATAGAARMAAGQINAEMANVQSLGVPQERIEELKAGIQSLAPEVGKMTSDLTGGMYQVVSAFGDSADTLKIVELNAKAGAAGLATTLDAINLTSAVTKGYGDTSYEAMEKASDLAFMTVKLGQTTFPELAASMGRVVPLAASLKLSQEELFAVMATATGVTGGAAEVSTQLRGVLQGLLDPTKELDKSLKSMGYASGGAMLEQEGLMGSIQKIVALSKESGKPISDYFGSIEAVTLALAMAEGQSDVYVEKLAQVRQASGATDEAFKAQTQGIAASGFAMKQMAVRSQVTMQKLGDALAPMFNKMIGFTDLWRGKLESLVDWFVKAPPRLQNYVTTAGAVAASTGPILIGFGTFLTFLPKMSHGWTILRLAVTSYTRAMVLAAASTVAPFLPVLAAVTLVAAGVMAIVTAVIGKDGLIGAWESAKASTLGFWEVIKGFIFNFQENMGILYTWLSANWRQALSDMATNLLPFVQNVGNNMLVIANITKRLFFVLAGSLSEQLSRAFKFIWEGSWMASLGKGLASGWTTFVGFLDSISEATKAHTGTMTGYLTEMFVGWASHFQNWMAYVKGDITMEQAEAEKKRIEDDQARISRENGLSANNAFRDLFKGSMEAAANQANQALDDFALGTEVKLGEAFTRVVDEEKGKLKGLMEGTEWKVEGPKFKLDLPKQEIAVEVNQDEAKKQVQAVQEEAKKANAKAAARPGAVSGTSTDTWIKFMGLDGSVGEGVSDGEKAMLIPLKEIAQNTKVKGDPKDTKHLANIDGNTKQPKASKDALPGMQQMGMFAGPLRPIWRPIIQRTPRVVPTVPNPPVKKVKKAPKLKPVPVPAPNPLLVIPNIPQPQIPRIPLPPGPTAPAVPNPLQRNQVPQFMQRNSGLQFPLPFTPPVVPTQPTAMSPVNRGPVNGRTSTVQNDEMLKVLNMIAEHTKATADKPSPQLVVTNKKASLA